MEEIRKIEKNKFVLLSNYNLINAFCSLQKKRNAKIFLVIILLLVSKFSAFLAKNLVD